MSYVTPKYSRRERVVFESALLILSLITLALAIPNAMKIRDQLNYLDRVYNKDDNAARDVMPMYLITPLATIFLSIVNLVLYYTILVPLLYTVAVNSIFFIAWIVTTGFWGSKHLNDKRLDSVIKRQLIIMVIVAAVVIALVYLAYTIVAVRDWRGKENVYAKKAGRSQERREYRLAMQRQRLTQNT